MGNSTITLSPIVKERITQTAHGFAAGDVVRSSGSSSFSKALADTAANSEAIGVVNEVVDADTFVVVYAGLADGLAGLTSGDVLYLSPTAAGTTTTTATSTTGQVLKPIMIAFSVTSAIVNIGVGAVIP